MLIFTRHTMRIFFAFIFSLGLSSQSIATIEIKGIDDALADAVREQSPLHNADCEAPDWWLENQLAETELIASQLLETQGFYLPTIVTSLESKNDCWLATLAIQTGGKAKIRTLDINGLDFLNTIEEKIDSKPVLNQPFNHKDYETYKSDILDLARAHGYLDSKWDTNRVTITLPQPEDNDQTVFADIQLIFNTGEQFLIGDIHQDLGDLDPSFVDKFIDLKPGIPLTKNDLDKAYRDLNATGYFSSLNIIPAYVETQGFYVPLNIEGTLARKRIYEIGAGFATDSGPRVRGEVTWRRINDRGDRARISATQATHESEMLLEYRRADGDDPRNRWLSLTAAYEYDEPDTYKREKTSLTANRSQRLDKTWLKSDVVQYSTETWRIGNTFGDTQLVSVGQGWQRSHSLGKNRIIEGNSLTGSWRAAAEALGSDIDVIQLQLAAKKIISFKDKWRLLGRAKVGLNSLDDLRLLPPDIRFFAGGDNSIRGYDLDTVGEIETVEDQLIVIGGKRLLEMSLEADYQIKQDWAAAVFIDAGSAFNDSPDLHKGVGVGGRWYSPLGPLRLDVAYGLDGLNPGWRLHISFGAEL